MLYNYYETLVLTNLVPRLPQLINANYTQNNLHYNIQKLREPGDDAIKVLTIG